MSASKENITQIVVLLWGMEHLCTIKKEKIRKDKIMKIKKFDVVEMKNSNRATILEVKGNNEYFAEIVNAYGITVDKKYITNNEISKVLYPKEQER